MYTYSLQRMSLPIRSSRDILMNSRLAGGPVEEKITTLSDIPDMAEILQRLRISDIGRVAATSRHFANVTSNDPLRADVLMRTGKYNIDIGKIPYEFGKILVDRHKQDGEWLEHVANELLMDNFSYEKTKILEYILDANPSIVQYLLMHTNKYDIDIGKIPYEIGKIVVDRHKQDGEWLEHVADELLKDKTLSKKPKLLEYVLDANPSIMQYVSYEYGNKDQRVWFLEKALKMKHALPVIKIIVLAHNKSNDIKLDKNIQFLAYTEPHVYYRAIQEHTSLDIIRCLVDSYSFTTIKDRHDIVSFVIDNYCDRDDIIGVIMVILGKEHVSDIFDSLQQIYHTYNENPLIGIMLQSWRPGKSTNLLLEALLYRYQNMLVQKNDYNVNREVKNGTLLHIAIERNYRSSFIEKVVNLSTQVRVGPLPFEIHENIHGRLPLHISVIEVVDKLHIDAFANSFDVFACVLHAFPRAACVKATETGGETPLYLAIRSFIGNYDINRWEYISRMIRFMLKECPESARVYSCFGQLPLHDLLHLFHQHSITERNHPDIGKELIQCVLDAYPGAIKKRDNRGSGLLPIQLAAKVNVDIQSIIFEFDNR